MNESKVSQEKPELNRLVDNFKSINNTTLTTIDALRQKLWNIHFIPSPESTEKNGASAPIKEAQTIVEQFEYECSRARENSIQLENLYTHFNKIV